MEHSADPWSADLTPILETALDAVVVMRADGRVAGWNAMAEKTFGWPHAARLGGKALSLTELALAIETPVSTTARWAAILKDRGLVETTAGVVALGSGLQLTTDGAETMEQLTGQWAAAFVSI